MYEHTLISQKHSDLHNVYVIRTGNILSSSGKTISCLCRSWFISTRINDTLASKIVQYFLWVLDPFLHFILVHAAKNLLLCPKTHTYLCTSEGMHPLLLRGARLVLSFPKLVNIVCAMAEYARPCNLCNCLNGTSHYGSCMFTAGLPILWTHTNN